MFWKPTCYLSPKLEGRFHAGKGGNAVFTRELVNAGERLAVWGGEIVDSVYLTQIPDELRRYSVQVEEGLYMISSQVGPADYINHSCSPNAGLRGQIVLVAMRDILPGEEVCYDYAMSDGSDYDQFECQCGSPDCRGHVTGEDWRNPALWERYAGYFSTYLQQRIDRLRQSELPQHLDNHRVIPNGI